MTERPASPTAAAAQPQTPRPPASVGKTAICAVIVVLSNAFGDFFMKRGLPDSGRLSTPLEYVTMLFQPWVTAGVLLLILWQLSRMALLSWADLSYVLPVTSIGYVVVAVIGRVFLSESISNTRWAAIVLIMAGVALVSGGTAPSTVTRASGHAPQEPQS
jgi:drug/metabolite transporter (DMT)-like permease